MTDQLNGDTHQTKVLLESQKLLLRLNELDAPILGHHVLNPKIGTVQSGIASPKEGYIQQSKVYAFICLKKITPQHDGNNHQISKQLPGTPWIMKKDFLWENHVHSIVSGRM